tara:strand:- start:6393 stop:7589 length:1197 start_codon:yes stop_codon:yes gene_type:complete
MENIIPYGKHNINEDDINNVVNVLKSGFLTQGPSIRVFENDFSNYIGSKYSVAVSNGTAALHLCALALGIKTGDKVITSPITFVASANCIRYCGGEIVFSDIDPNTYLLDLNKLKQFLDKSPKGTYKAVVAVNFAGRAIDLKFLREIADDYGLSIIEDSCHSPGGYFLDSAGVKYNCGSGKFADLAIFSFHPVKHIACGEGGMITTNNYELYRKLLLLRSHGISRNESLFENSTTIANGFENTDAKYPGWYMEMLDLGYNYRLSDIHAALGLSQLKRANSGLSRRKEIAAIYNNVFKNKGYIEGHSKLIEGHAYHLYIIEVPNRLGLYNYLRKNNIYCQIHYVPCHLMPYYKQFGYNVGDFPVSENYYRKCISLPIYPKLTKIEQQYVIEKIDNFYNE